MDNIISLVKSTNIKEVTDERNTILSLYAKKLFTPSPFCSLKTRNVEIANSNYHHSFTASTSTLLWNFSHRYHLNWHSFVIKIQYVFFLVHGKLFPLWLTHWAFLRVIFHPFSSSANELSVTSKAHSKLSIDSLGTTNNSHFHLLSIKFSVFLEQLFFRISFSLWWMRGKIFLRKNYGSNLRKMCNL